MLLTILVCGAGTFLLRVLPLWRRQRAAPPSVRWMAHFSQAIGPAAMASLFVSSLISFAGPAPAPGELASIALALLALGVVRWRAGGIALPTLVGALVLGISRLFL